ncbi:MAG: vWA domain-containing protein [Myxococcota bacterium]
MNRTAIIFMTAFALVVVALTFGVNDIASHPGPAVGPGALPDKPGSGQSSDSTGGHTDNAGKPAPSTENLACSPRAPATVRASLTGGSIQAALSQSKLLRSASGELFVSFDIDIEDMVLEDRRPLDLALVIDRSGSMRGPPMTHAKQAAMGLVDRLGPQDRVSIVTYDTTIERVIGTTVVDDAGRQRLKEAISRIQPRGMTNIHGGLGMGYQELAGAESRGSIARLAHLSDGIANTGVTDQNAMVTLASNAAMRGIRTTSIGLGVNYNEQLMEALAEAGRGQYYYVRHAETLDEVFAGELRNMQATVATQVELRIEPCEGVQVAEVYGLRSRLEGSTTVVDLADLAGGDQRRVIARLSTAGADQASLPVLNATLRYQDVDEGRTRYATMALAAGTSFQADVIDASVNRDVMAQVIEVQGSVALREATASFRRGDRQAAARRLERTQRDLTEQANRYQVSQAPAARRTSGIIDSFRNLFGASADALAGEEAREVELEAQVEARAMERSRRD